MSAGEAIQSPVLNGYKHLSDAERAHQALARIRAFYAVETEAKHRGHTGLLPGGPGRSGAGRLGEWLADQRPRALPGSLIGEAITHATNEWHALGVYLTDGRLTIDNGPAEQAIRPPAVGRRNWLHVAGDGGLRPAAVLPSVTASLRRYAAEPWTYLRQVPTVLPSCPAGADITESLPDAWAESRAGTNPAAG